MSCYHATLVDTNLEPSTRTVEDKWASSWIFGLVPPETVRTAEECPGGIARVETQLSFLNQLVGLLTIGIYTPMSIVVTCAANADDDADDRASIQADPEASMDAKQLTLHEAAVRSAELGTPVYVSF